MEQKGRFYSGTSGLVVPVPKHSFPPEHQHRSRLEYYAFLFNSIEINSSFYKLPRKATVAKWAEAVPGSFRFTYKLWRDITHNKGLEYDPQLITDFMEAIDLAGTKKGSLLIQFPPSVKIHLAHRVWQLLQDIGNTPLAASWDIAVEFRDKSWYQDEVYEMLDARNMAMVLHDKAASNAPMNDLSTDFVYLRFHGPDGSYRGSYEDDFLYEYAQYINAWLEDGKTVYCYFNNTMGAAVQNLMRLNEYVGEE